MYLRALEMQGFKSFPDKTRIAFDKPVTGIVGPNGSGKSNISDAVLWVMGEQSSRTLRGGKMEDVIFGGTQKRGPMGFAEVSLILDNSARIFDMDDSEVMITRRYYRTGDSEYYINKRSVRLKDIVELLMDTGMGREGYSIIGQGRIAEILSAKSTDRREIFEEAAGIARFRHKKEESERRLERTNDNLIRINDKIDELQMQVEPLKKQAETAKKYLVLRDELRGLEISVWTDSLSKISENSKKLEIDCEIAKRDLDENTAEVERAYALSEELSDKMRAKDVEAEKERENLNVSTSRIAEYEANMAALRVRAENNAKDAERIRSEIKEQENRDGGLSLQIEEKRTRVSEIEKRREELNETSRALIQESEKLIGASDETSRKLSEILARENETSISLGNANQRLSSLTATESELSDRAGSISRDISGLSETLEKYKTQGAECTAAYDSAQRKIAAQNNIISGYEKRLESRGRKAQELSDRQMKMTMDAGAIRNRINLLTEMEKDYQGYSKAVKLIMQEHNRGTLKNIHGTAAELIDTDEKYSLAIETALGGAMQNIIVDTEEDGKNCINFLKRREGRATFMPISTMHGTTLNERGLENEPGFEGTALSLITYDKKYEGIYAFLLGKIAVADTLDDAIRIARKYGHRFRIVTLDGQVLNAGGSMTGGAAAGNAGIISRANELKRLSEQEASMKSELEETNKALFEAKRELAASEYEMSVAKNALRDLEDGVLKLEADKNHWAVLIENASQALEAQENEKSGLSGRISANDEDIRRVRAEISGLTAESEKLSRQAEEMSSGQGRLNEQRESVSAKLSELRAESASLEAEMAAVIASISDLTSLKDDLSGGRARQNEALEALKAESGLIEEETAKCRKLIDDENAVSAGYQKKIESVMAQKLEIEAERTRCDKRNQERNKLLIDQQLNCARLEQKKQALEMEERQIIDKLWDSYELTRTAAMEQAVPVENLSESKKRIGELKKEIGRLGNPNIGAIDEYERVNSRYTYLTEQRDDVESSKNELLGIIADITAEMQDIFAREFDAINESFKETFHDFFGGGSASLELEDPSDVLNCGIEIRVQPPGKSLKALTLLSGGEKAFVAIALYFAILRIKPTPFVIMDEIEAALDEANVLRYAEQMRRMSDKTQMIVITHRRGTMEEADVLYGVTMQEQGISRILSIDVEEAERTIKQ